MAVLTFPAMAAFLAVLATSPAPGAALECAVPLPRRPVATYSIVAFDPASGQLGVAVQSHWFSVGSLVPWAEAGVGAVATQSLVDVSYGPLGLALMAGGRSAPDALRALVSTDAGAAGRQVGMVDAQGRTAVHTGDGCIGMAGHVEGPHHVVAANLMEKPTVWSAMDAAYRSAEGDLAARLLAALDAAEREGGDVRGRQSAALIVVRGVPSSRPWEDRIFDLRVEDHPDPVNELRRLVGLARAYRLMNEGDEHLGRGDTVAALAAYRAAQASQPEHPEIAFWTAVTLATNGDVEAARRLLGPVYRARPALRLLPPRLVKAGLLKNDPALVEALVGP